MDRWVVDAGMSHDADDGIFCFCPLGENGDVIVGMNFLSDKPPPNVKLVGIVHEDGQDAVEAWCNQHGDALDTLYASVKGEGI